MRLSWNEIRQNARRFSNEWKDAHYEKGETQTFYDDFFAIFGISRRRVASFEAPVKKLGGKQGFIDLFWKGVLLVEQKSLGRDLVKAKRQALDYFPNLKEYELPRFILVSDFQTFQLFDLDENSETAFELKDLHKNVEAFGFILGVQKRTFRDQDPVNIAASEQMGKLHDALLNSGYVGDALERLLVRLLFCLFADDTGIFERDIFLEFIQQRTREDGSDTGPLISQLFEVLNTEEDVRQRNLDEDLAKFPYINGGLFEERLAIPSFDAEMRGILIEACAFNWNAISPAIFGSLFQSVMDSKERRSQGAHYTTEKNILKVIKPLFLDELWAEFDRIKSRKTEREKHLKAFRSKLRQLRFLDPACGCGNFLVIAYREIRTLELELIKELKSKGYLALDASVLSIVDVDQFYGIELGEFPRRIAEVALWMMDHIMNNRISLEFGETFARIPLVTSPHILCADALELDWSTLLPSEQCSYVFGNPPFIGSKYQNEEQRAQVKRLANTGKGSGGTLDYVTAWFIKSGEYVQKGNAKIGFVSTNSISQGEQVAQLWPTLFEKYSLEISFAHKTFAWGSDARGKAHVHVVIIGLEKNSNINKLKRLFNYNDIKCDPDETQPIAISPYLFDAGKLKNNHTVVKEVSKSICNAPKLISGSKPIDGGNYIFSKDEMISFLDIEPNAISYFKPYLGGQEFINGLERWILSLHDIEPNKLRSMPSVAERVNSVRQFRKKSKSKPTQKLAETPNIFHINTLPSSEYIVIPKVSSERREYIPIGWINPPTIPSDLLHVLLDNDIWNFAILTSKMHMSWLRYIGGRLESRYRYSINLVYNTFPWPKSSTQEREKTRALAKEVIASRNNHIDSTLADLYDPNTMPNDLRRAHKNLDTAVDKLYKNNGFSSDGERVEHLLSLYENLIS